MGGRPTQIVTEELETYIIEEYKKCYSVSELKRNPKLILGYDKIKDILVKNNIFEGYEGKNYKKVHTQRIRNAIEAKYGPGIINIGQITGGWRITNNIPYTKITKLSDEFKIYTKECQKVAQKNKNLIKNNQYCYYTGIQFKDYEEGDNLINPNDPRKKSIDHRIPIIYCYLNDWTPGQTSDINNMVHVLRYVNTIKGNTLEESFIPIAIKIRRIFKNEGFQSN